MWRPLLGRLCGGPCVEAPVCVLRLSTGSVVQSCPGSLLWTRGDTMASGQLCCAARGHMEGTLDNSGWEITTCRETALNLFAAEQVLPWVTALRPHQRRLISEQTCCKWAKGNLLGWAGGEGFCAHREGAGWVSVNSGCPGSCLGIWPWQRICKYMTEPRSHQAFEEWISVIGLSQVTAHTVKL